MTHNWLTLMRLHPLCLSVVLAAVSVGVGQSPAAAQFLIIQPGTNVVPVYRSISPAHLYTPAPNPFPIAPTTRYSLPTPPIVPHLYPGSVTGTAPLPGVIFSTPGRSSRRTVPVYVPGSFPTEVDRAILVNPTLINTPIRNSTLVNPTIITFPR